MPFRSFLRIQTIALLLIVCEINCCVDEQPSCPLVPIQDSDSSPLISAASNQSAYAGGTAIVTASVNISRLENSHSVIRLYINGCGFDDCEYESDSISNTFSATCQVQNILYQTKVQFVVIDNSILCFNDSFINIKGIPGPLEIKGVTLQCDGVSIGIEETEDDTVLRYELYHSSDKLNPVYAINTTNTSLLIPPHVFSNKEMDDFMLSITPSNLAGQGVSTNRTVTLDLSDYFNLSVSGLYLIANGENICAVIDFKINANCPLSVPPNIVVHSNCSSNPFTFMFGNGTTATIPLMPNRNSCMFDVLVGTNLMALEYKTYATNIVQDAQWTVEGQDITVSCTLLQGSIDTGCTIRIYSLDDKIHKTLNLSRGSEDAVVLEGTLGPLPEGLYQIEVKDSWDYGQSTRPNPVIEDSFSVFKEEIPVDQPTATSTVSPSTSISLRPTDNINDSTIKTENLAAIIGGVVGSVCGLLIIVGFIFAVLRLCRHRKFKMKQFQINTEAPNNSQSVGIVVATGNPTEEPQSTNTNGDMEYFIQPRTVQESTDLPVTGPTQRVLPQSDTTEARGIELIHTGNKSPASLQEEGKRTVCEESTQKETTITSDTSRSSGDPLLMEVQTQPSYKSKKPENIAIPMAPPHPVQNTEQNSSSQSRPVYVPSLSAGRSSQKQVFTFPVVNGSNN